MDPEKIPNNSWDTPPLNSALFSVGWWGTAASNLLIALFNPLLYAGMAPALDARILGRILTEVSGPVMIAGVIFLVVARRFFVAGHTLAAIAVELISVPACVWLAWEASR